jgi:hypothetical protein
VATSEWLNRYGLDKRSAYQYLKSNWLESIGTGAYKRFGDCISWQGALHSIQNQLNLEIHIGAKTALELQGKAHNISYKNNKTFLFSPTKANLPKWFKNQKWQTDIELIRTMFLSPDLGLRDFDMHNFRVRVSSAERAILETLYLVPNQQDFQECYYLMEGLIDIRPKVMQTLLEDCRSIKVKRLFLFMAKKANLPILKKLNLDLICLGSGKRVIVPDGKFDSEYEITYPREFQTNE